MLPTGDNFNPILIPRLDSHGSNGSESSRSGTSSDDQGNLSDVAASLRTYRTNSSSGSCPVRVKTTTGSSVESNLLPTATQSQQYELNSQVSHATRIATHDESKEQITPIKDEENCTDKILKINPHGLTCINPIYANRNPNGDSTFYIGRIKITYHGVPKELITMKLKRMYYEQIVRIREKSPNNNPSTDHILEKILIVPVILSLRGLSLDMNDIERNQPKPNYQRSEKRPESYADLEEMKKGSNRLIDLIIPRLTIF